MHARIAVLERASCADRGGNTRYSTATFRMRDVHTINDDFIDRLRTKTDASADYIEVLARQAPEAVLWAEGHGLEFAPGQRVFLTSNDARIQPEGAGSAIVRHFFPEHGEIVAVVEPPIHAAPHAVRLWITYRILGKSASYNRFLMSLPDIVGKSLRPTT